MSLKFKTDDLLYCIAHGAIALLIARWTWDENYLFQVAGSRPNRCWTFFLFGQQLQLESYNFIHATL